MRREGLLEYDARTITRIDMKVEQG